MARLTFDSCFLIDFERERAGKKITGSPREFLARNSAVELSISPVALGEYAIGFPDPSHPELIKVMENFELIPSSPEVALIYARIYRDLSKSKSQIGGNDLWIAAYSLAVGHSLVTNNTREFMRIDGLNVITY